MAAGGGHRFGAAQGFSGIRVVAGVQTVKSSSVSPQAVAGGKWLLVEGIDSAPPEVLAALAPLLEGRALHLSHRAQVITAGPGFQFLATITSAPGLPAVQLRLAQLSLPNAFTSSMPCFVSRHPFLNLGFALACAKSIALTPPICFPESL